LFLGAYLKLSNASLRLPGLILQLGLTLSQLKDFERPTDEENARAQVSDNLDLYFIVCKFILYSHDSSVRRKPSSADPSKKITQPAPSSYATPVAPSVGVTGSTTLSAAEDWDYCRWTTDFLEGLKNREADQEGNHVTPSLFLSFDLFG
jgi:hypothetical protein